MSVGDRRKANNDLISGKYKDFFLYKNKYSNYIEHYEKIFFYSSNDDYSCGNYERVKFLQISQMEEEIKKQKNSNILNFYKRIFASLFYLNPNMTNSDFWKIFYYYSDKRKYTIINSMKLEDYKYLYINRKNIKRQHCYRKRYKVIANEYKLAKLNKIKTSDPNFRSIRRLWYSKNARSTFSFWLDEEIKKYFLDHLNSSDLSIQKIAYVFNLTEKTIKKHLNNIGIIYLNDKIVYKNLDNEEKEIQKFDPMDKVIIDTIKYHIRESKQKIKSNLFIDVCKYVDYRGKEYLLKRDKYEYFFSKNKDWKNKVKEYNDNFKYYNSLIDVLPTKFHYPFLKAENVSNRWVDKNGKVHYKETFDRNDIDNIESLFEYDQLDDHNENIFNDLGNYDD